jgi:hypothetical protein
MSHAVPAWPEPTDGVLRVAILGAPRSGKTTLGQALQQRLQAHGWAVIAVPDPLAPHDPKQVHAHAVTQAKAWVDARLRLATQPTRPAVLLADDVPPLAAACAADQIAGARRFDAGWDLRLLMAWDGPTPPSAAATGGPQTQHTEQDLRDHLQREGLAHTVLHGPKAARLEAAWQSLRAAAAPQRSSEAATWRAACDCCADPIAERALFSRLLGSN